MRLQSFERAKGELNAMLMAYWTSDEDQYKAARDCINKFIEDLGEIVG